ncbi:MAG TPA: DUF5719 family protein [Ornithinibacter sp.]|nr:DUF5719 family protein [Ornithinibacter sp.]
MSRLGSTGAGLKQAVRRVNVAGVARVALVVGAGVGLVHVATAQPVTVDLVAAAGEEQAPLVGTSLATRVAQTCPGPELSGIPGIPDVPVPVAVSAAAGPADLMPVPARGAGELTATSGSTTLLTLESRPEGATVAMPRAPGLPGAAGSDPVLLTGSGAMAPAVAGSQEWRVDTKDLRGLVTTPCGAGGSDLWLLAGGAGPGRQERLVITNPGANPVSTEVSVHGTAGRLGEPVVETVAPGGRVSLLLDARHGAERTPAVHVRSDGGGVQATLTDTWVDGSTALGAETTVPAAAPGTVAVVPGVVVDALGTTSVRVAVPDDQDAVVKVTVLDREGLVPLTGESVLSVAAGAVGELPLAGLPAGTYAVALRSDVPVVASAFTSIGNGTAPGDVTWSPAATGVSTLGGAAFSNEATITRTAHLVSTGGNSTAEVVSVIDGEPRTREVELLADRVATVPLDGATSVWVRRITGSGELRGSIVSSSGTGAARLLSSMPLQESAVTSEVSRAFPLP